MENIGILISEKGAGIFQYGLSIADSLIKYSNKYNYKIVTHGFESFNWLTYTNTNSAYYVFIPNKKSSFKNKISKIKIIFNLVICNDFFNVQNKEVVSKIKKHQIKLLIAPYASLLGYNNKIPYIVSIPDIMHKYYPSFPEYPLKERIKRNIVYKNTSKHSIFTIVDSQQGGEDLDKFFGIPKEKIRIVSIMPAGYIYKYKNMSLEISESILKKYNLPERFLFYPAQFWYHKNHIRLVKSLKFLKDFYNVKIYIVLVGSPKESYKKIMNFIKKSDISNQIICLGYVSDEEIVALYKKAVALVYPSLFGPTNIPPLEAMLLGTPVICSDLFSMPKHINGAGLLFNPFKVEDIAVKIYKIWTDKKLRQELIKKGYSRMKDVTMKEYAKQWEKIIDEALERIK